MTKISDFHHPYPPLGFDVGEVFPDIVLPAIDTGEPLSLKTLRGKKVLLHIFASW